MNVTPPYSAIEDLRYQIRRRRIVPVVGPGLLRTTDESSAFAQRVLGKFGVNGPASSLFDASQLVCASESSGPKRLERVRSLVWDMVEERGRVSSQVLDRLASISNLRTVLTTTIEPDIDLAFRSKSAAAAQVATVAVSTRGAFARQREARERALASGTRAVVHLFGAAFPTAMAQSDAHAEFAVSYGDAFDFIGALGEKDLCTSIRSFTKGRYGADLPPEQPAFVAEPSSHPRLLVLGVNLLDPVVPQLLSSCARLVDEGGGPVRDAFVVESGIGSKSWLLDHLRAFTEDVIALDMDPAELIAELAAGESHIPSVVTLEGLEQAKGRALLLAAPSDHLWASRVAKLLARGGVPVAMAPDDDTLFDEDEIEALLAVTTVWVPVATSNGAEPLSDRPLAKAMRRITLADPSRRCLHPVWCAAEPVARPLQYLLDAEAAETNEDAVPPAEWLARVRVAHERRLTEQR